MMARTPRLFRTRPWVLGKNPMAADIIEYGIILGGFLSDDGLLCALIRIASIRRF